MKLIKKKYSMLRLLYLCFIGIFIFQQTSAQLIGDNSNGSVKSDKIIAFTDVNVIPMDKERVLLHQTVIIKDRKIAQMGDAKKVKIPSGAVRINATGKYLIPGLGDMHTHIQPFNQDTAKAALLLHASYGVTTIRNVDYLPKGAFGGFAKLDGPAILNIRSLANNGKIVSPRIYTSGPWYGTNKGEGEGIPTTGVYQRVKALKDAGFDFLKVHDESQVSFDSVIAACHSLNFPFMGHAIENMKMDKTLNSGYRSIEHLTGYLAQLFEVDGELKTRDTTGLIAKMAKATATAKSKIWNCPTYTLYMYDGKKPSPVILKRSEMQYLTDSTFARWERWFNAPESTEPGLIKNPERIVRFRKLMVKALYDAGAPLLSGT
ncbi:MAG: hypothetical protein J7497_17060, partial [Chitinophagaceae bacterium]|nr:hypothetical protein [Chitinophagaceae bacterium]